MIFVYIMAKTNDMGRSRARDRRSFPKPRTKSKSEDAASIHKWMVKEQQLETETHTV